MVYFWDHLKFCQSSHELTSTRVHPAAVPTTHGCPRSQGISPKPNRYNKTQQQEDNTRGEEPKVPTTGRNGFRSRAYFHIISSTGYLHPCYSCYL